VGGGSLRTERGGHACNGAGVADGACAPLRPSDFVIGGNPVNITSLTFLLNLCNTPLGVTPTVRAWPLALSHPPSRLWCRYVPPDACQAINKQLQRARVLSTQTVRNIYFNRFAPPNTYTLQRHHEVRPCSCLGAGRGEAGRSGARLAA
jgi:hypothetical protein